MFVQFIRRLRRHRRKFFFQKNIHKKNLFVPEKDFKILRLRSHKRRKKFAASKTIFLKRDIIFLFADKLASIYEWSNRKIQDSPFTQVTFFEHVPQQQQKNTPKTFQPGIIFFFSPSTRKTPTQASITDITFCSYETKFKKKKNYYPQLGRLGIKKERNLLICSFQLTTWYKFFFYYNNKKKKEETYNSALFN